MAFSNHIMHLSSLDLAHWRTDLKMARNSKTCPTPHEVVQAISELAQGDATLSHFSTFSTAIYDSAWLAMVCKNDHGTSSYLFPQCFGHLIETQQDDGTWKTYSSQIDGILNTLAALLAMVTRERRGSFNVDEKTELARRIQMAQFGVLSLLQSWDVDGTVHVGHEVLVTSLLRQLESFGMRFEFLGRAKLQLLYERKMRKFSPDLIYSNHATTILHSLEALTGLIEFDRVSHHCSEELGIFGSPAATAAYLINASSWDHRAVTYLETTVASYGSSGRVPSAFPTPVFEITWAMSFMLSHAAASDHLGYLASSEIASFLAEVMKKQNGVVGFAPGILEDADDTARTLITLARLGRDVDPAPMIRRFEANDHFRTYEMERNPSFSANCNVLLALLELESIDQYLPQIQKTLAFLLQKWESGEITDKWNLSPQYCIMLMAEALVCILRKYDGGCLQLLPVRMVKEQIPVSLCQILLRTLGDQQMDGSWGTALEVTSYSVLTVIQCLSLPWGASLRDSLLGCISRGRKFIESQYAKQSNLHYLWVEKTSFESGLLRMAYCSTALHAEEAQHNWSPEIKDCFPSSGVESKKIRHLLSALPIFTNLPSASVDLILIEATHFSNYLREARHSILQRNNMPMSKDKYLMYIPILWLACDHIGGHTLSSNLMREMTLLSLFNFQVDEFMETVVANLTGEKLQLLSSMLRDECGLDKELHFKQAGERHHWHTKIWECTKMQNGNGHADAESTPEASLLERATEVLRRFIEHVLQHPAVVRSQDWAQRELAVELYNFLIAHINHNGDNISWQKAEQNKRTGYVSEDTSRHNYFKWVHSTGSDDTSCPFSFQFFACLVSKPGETAFDGPQARYFSQSLVRHLAAMCRQYNDYGSATRDAIENNLNSLDFAEFHASSAAETAGVKCQVAASKSSGMGNGSANGYASDGYSDGVSTDEAKTNLMAIAEFERVSMQLAMQSLSQVVQSPSVVKAVKVFIDVTDSFGQLYVQKDVASRKQIGR